MSRADIKVIKGKGIRVAVLGTPSHCYGALLTHLPYEITQCYLLSDTSEHIPPWPVLDLSTSDGWKAVQDGAARLVTGERRSDHITPVLHQLHCLPVRQRVDLR